MNCAVCGIALRSPEHARDHQQKAHPSPSDVSEALAGFNPHFFEDIRRDFRTAHNDGLEKPRGAQVRGDPNGHSDPTGEVVVDKAVQRAEVEYAGKEILRAAESLKAADGTLAKVLKRPKLVTVRRGRYQQIRMAKRELHRQTRAQGSQDSV